MELTPPTRTIAVKQPIHSITGFFRIGQYIAPMILIIADYFAVVFAELIAWYLRATFIPQYFPMLSAFHINNTYVYFVFPLTFFLFLLYEGMYSKRLPFWKSVETIFKICTYVSALAIAVMYFTGKAEDISRTFIGFTWMLSFLYLIYTRYITKRMLVAAGLWQKPVVIVGAGKTAEILAKNFEGEPNLGYKIVGLVEDHYAERPLMHRYLHIGGFSDAEQAIINSGVQDVIIATPGLDRGEMLDLVYRIQPYVRNLTIVPDLFGVPLSNMEVETLFNEKTVMLRMCNNMMVLRNRMLKNTFDFIGSICGTFLITPILLAIAVAIYISSPGPVIFAHMRIGRNGKEFPCYKFRSMVINAQEVLEDYLLKNPEARREWEQDFKLKDDPRVTGIGKFLRKTSLDELPQLFNVIKNEMSLVGPRPIINKEIPKYGEYIQDYYLVRPGITGYWQVSGRSDVDYDSRVQMDSWYVRNWSFWQDIVLLVKTVSVVLDRKGAY